MSFLLIHLVTKLHHNHFFFQSCPSNQKQFCLAITSSKVAIHSNFPRNYFLLLTLNSLLHLRFQSLSLLNLLCLLFVNSFYINLTSLIHVSANCFKYFNLIFLSARFILLLNYEVFLTHRFLFLPVRLVLFVEQLLSAVFLLFPLRLNYFIHLTLLKLVLIELLNRIQLIVLFE